jgi:hypothetical protein
MPCPAVITAVDDGFAPTYAVLELPESLEMTTRHGPAGTVQNAADVLVAETDPVTIGMYLASWSRS